jgi:hypothetical protein
MKIGIEYEGVLLDSNNRPVKFGSLDWKTVRDPIIKKYFGEYCCDGNDYLIEVRTTPHVHPELLLNEFYFKKNRIERLLRQYGLKVAWTEMKVPTGQEDDKKGNKTQFVFDEQGKHYFDCKDSKYRGGGLHINFDTYKDNIQALFRMYYRVKYTETMFNFKSKYRNKLLFREHPFGYEIISTGFTLTNATKPEFNKLIHKIFSYD